LEPDLSGFSSTDYQKLQEIIRRWRKAAREQISQIRELNPGLATSYQDQPRISTSNLPILKMRKSM
jgi:hypothetical protein